ADPEMRAKVAEAQDLVEQRTQVTTAFISDWKKLSQATNNYANLLDQAFVQGNKAMYAEVDRGIQAKSATDVLVACNRNFDRSKAGVEDKRRGVEEMAGGGASE